MVGVGEALWSGTNKNRDVSTGPLARPFARSLAPFTRSLAPDCSLRSHPPLRSLPRSLAHFAHSLARGKVNFLCLKMIWFCPIVHRPFIRHCRHHRRLRRRLRLRPCFRIASLDVDQREICI